jgi:hypothetical protein
MFRNLILNFIIIFSSLACFGNSPNNLREALAEYISEHSRLAFEATAIRPQLISVEDFYKALEEVAKLTKRAFYVKYSADNLFTFEIRSLRYRKTNAEFSGHKKISNDALFVVWRVVLSSASDRGINEASTFLDKIGVAFGRDALNLAFMQFSNQSYSSLVSDRINVVSESSFFGVFSALDFRTRFRHSVSSDELGAALLRPRVNIK